MWGESHLVPSAGFEPATLPLGEEMLYPLSYEGGERTDKR